MSDITAEKFVEAAEECVRFMKLQEDDYRALLKRYDDLNKRNHDMQAELEYLRREVNRG